MSDLLNSASLVLIPSGYKEDVVYSAVPTDGSGDLSFTRASNGTRVNSAGLVEVVAWNLCINSEQFDTASWLKSSTTITANSGVAPNGTTTADKIVPTTTGTNRWAEQSRAITIDNFYTNSAYIKADGFSWVALHHIDGSIGAWFNVSNGTVGTVNAGCTASIESVGNGWYRCSVAKNSGGTTGYTVVQLADADNSGTATASGTNGLLIYGAQLNIGSTAKPYFPTTDRLNVPRLTYQNGGGGCPSLLLEKQSTNLVQYSENLAASSWTTADNTRTANYATSPDGTQNATRIIPNTNNVAHPTYQVIVVSAATSITAYAKADGYNFFQIYGGEASGVSGSSARFSVVVNLSTFAVDTIDTISSSQVNISNMGNGWAKITINNFTQFTSGNYFLAVAAIPSSGLSRNSVLDIDFAGNGTSGVLTYGIQVEQSTYPTSYIPTTSASATRVADACFKTGISSLIGQTEGVMFAEINVPSIATAGNYSSWQLNDGSTSNLIDFTYYSTGRIQAIAFIGGSLQVNIDLPSFGLTAGNHKIAFAYKLNDYVLYVDGVQVGSDTSAQAPAMSKCDLFAGLNQITVYKQFVVFPTRLTNAELASLTTL